MEETRPGSHARTHCSRSASNCRAQGIPIGQPSSTSSKPCWRGLRAGELVGGVDDDDFGYRFIVDGASSGPSIFDSPPRATRPV